MKARHKAIMGGAIGGLAVATAAASGAFACTASAAVEVRNPSGLPTVIPGQPVDVTVRTFHPGHPIQVTWENATSVAKVTEQVGPTFTIRMRIPSDAQPGTRYNLMARQFEPTEGKVWSNFASVSIAGTSQQGPAPTLPPPPPPVDNRTETTEPPARNTQAPATNGSTAAAPVAKAPAVAPQAQLQGPAAAAPATADVAAAQPAVAGPQGAGTPDSPIIVGEAVPQAALPVATEDLWSGLNADTTPSLLDSGAAPAPRNTFPVGGVLLLGTGVLAMAGVALEAARRQRQAVRVYRR